MKVWRACAFERLHHVSWGQQHPKAVLTHFHYKHTIRGRQQVCGSASIFLLSYTHLLNMVKNIHLFISTLIYSGNPVEIQKLFYRRIHSLNSHSLSEDILSTSNDSRFTLKHCLVTRMHTFRYTVWKLIISSVLCGFIFVFSLFCFSDPSPADTTYILFRDEDSHKPLSLEPGEITSTRCIHLTTKRITKIHYLEKMEVQNKVSAFHDQHPDSSIPLKDRFVFL